MVAIITSPYAQLTYLVPAVASENPASMISALRVSPTASEDAVLE